MQTNNISHLLPIKNDKIIDLRTCEVRDKNENDQFDFVCPVNFIDSELPFANKYFNELTTSLTLLQKCLGYCLTGDTSSQKFFVIKGIGNNGKTTLMEVLKYILSNSHKMMSVDGGVEQLTNVELNNSRLGIYSEINSDNDISTMFGGGLLSLIAGENVIVKKNNNVVLCPSSIKIILDTNVDLNFANNIARCAITIPFTGQFVSNQQFLQSLLDDHVDELFSWMCLGAKMWYADNNF